MNPSNDSSKTPLKRNSNELVLVPPPPPPKRIKRPAVVLDEETYIDALSQIIARDYFPGLVQNGAKQDFLEALDSRNEAWIQDASKRLTDTLSGKTPGRPGVSFPSQNPISTFGDTPTLINTPIAVTSTVQASDLNLSLAAFQAKYTSEDNESFSALLDRQNLRNREKHAFLWNGNKLDSARLIAYRKAEAHRVAAVGSSNALTTRNCDNRPAMPNYAKSDAQNTLLFLPDSIEDTHVTHLQEAEAKSSAPPKAIIHCNTRLKDLESSDPLEERAISPSLTAINDAILGHSSHSGDIPRVGGYAFVDADPTAAEVEAFKSGSIDPKAILSSLVDGANATSNPFSIREVGQREALHHRLLDQKKKNSKGRISEVLSPGAHMLGKTPTPRFKTAPKSKHGLTPAARMLRARLQSDLAASTPSPSISNFDLTPKKSRKSTSIPGLTPKANKSKLRPE